METAKSFLNMPEKFTSQEELDEYITEPDASIINMIASLDGDIMVLGIGGKIGSHIGTLIKRSISSLGSDKKVYGVSRFSNPEIQNELENSGIVTIPCDLLKHEEVARLPQAANIIYMVGRKFGTSDSSYMTWAVNTLVPKNVCEHFSKSRFVVFSTGCVYDLINLKFIGSTEETETIPLGDYANSAIGRERVFEYYAETKGLPVLLFRLNYSIDLRYGVLLDIAQKVKAEEPIDISMGHVNVIWQGDVIRQAVLSLALASVPAERLNITGPETVSVRYAAEEFGKRLGKKVQFTGEEQDTALLSNSNKAAHIFGYPKVPLLKMIDWIAEWILAGGETLDKPTHFETRDGEY